MSGLTRSRLTALVAVTPLLLLAACGDDKPARITDSAPGPTCSTQGTVDAQPASSLRAAVAPYIVPGQSFRLAKKAGGTAEVLLRGDGDDEPDSVVTLVRTRQGWVVTSVTRC